MGALYSVGLLLHIVTASTAPMLVLHVVQEEMASISKRRAGNALGKQRSILDFFRTPPLELGAKRQKVRQTCRLLF